MAQKPIRDAAAPLPIWVLISFLVGLGGAGTLCGFLRLFQARFDPLPQTTWIILAAAFLCVAVSPWLPQGVIRFVSSRVPSGAGTIHEPDRRSPSPLMAHALDLDEDRELVLGTACLLAGLSVLLVVSMVGPIRELCEWLRTSFFWTPTTLRIADLLIAGATQFVPITLIGLAVVCVLAVQDDPLPGRTSTMRMAAILWGAAFGAWAVMWRFALSLTVPLTLVISSVPLFLAAVLTLLHAGRRPPAPARYARVDRSAAVQDPLPEMGEAGLGLLLVGLLSWSIMLSVAGVVWHRAAIRMLETLKTPPVAVIALWLVSVGAGAWLMRPRTPRASLAASTGGLRLCLAGFAGSVVIVAISARGRPAADPTRSDGQAALVILGALVLHAFCSGAVLPALLRGVLSRSATRGLAHARIMTTWAVAAAITLLVLALWLSRAQGTLIAICATCLASLITGAALVIYDSIDATRARRSKLLGVFACLLALMIVLPRAGSHWRLDYIGRGSIIPGRASPGGGDGSTVQNRGFDRLGGLAISLPPRTKVCWIGGPAEEPVAATWPTGHHQIHVEHWPHPRDTADPGSPKSSLRQLRTDGRHFDLIILEPAERAAGLNPHLWAEESLRRMAHLLSPSGLALTWIPLNELEPGDARTLAMTFRRAFGAQVYWVVKQASENHPADLLLIALGSSGGADPRIVRALIGPAEPRAIDVLLGGSSGGAAHSLEHPRLACVFRWMPHERRSEPITLMAPTRK